MLDRMFLTVLRMTAAGSVVIAAVLALRLLLKRAPKAFSCLLWLVALFRLLCPLTPETAVSLIPQTGSLEAWYTLEEEPISVLGAAEAAYRAVGDAANGGLGIQRIRLSGGAGYTTSNWWEVWVLFGQYVWAAGFAAMLLAGIVSWLRLRQRLRTAAPLRDNIWLADGIETPFVLGLFRPNIYLPSSLMQREPIILHERCHIRHGDHAVKLLAWLALCIHWFNPLVWAAFALSGRDMEMRCDEAVLRDQPKEVRADYAAALLRLSTGKRVFAGSPLAFGEGDPKSRIQNILRWKKPKWWMAVLAAAVCIAAVLLLATDPLPHREEIYLNGAVYVRESGEVSKIPADAEAAEIGVLERIVHRTGSHPTEERSGVNLDERYAGCPIHISGDGTMLWLEDYGGGYLPFALSAQPVFGTTYLCLADALVYQTPVLSSLWSGEFLLCLGEDQTLYIRESQWIKPGVFEKTRLTEERFDAWFRSADGSAGWFEDLDAASLRQNNKNAWQLRVSEVQGTAFYYLLEQKDGSLLLAMAYVDSFDTVAKDPSQNMASEIEWVFRLSYGAGYGTPAELEEHILN